MFLRVIFLILILVPFINVAQEYDIKWSDLEKKNGSLINLFTDPQDSSDFYALRWSGGRMFGHYKVSRHENNLLVSSGKLKLIADGSMANFEDVRLIGDELVVFLSDLKDGERIFYMQKYNKQIEPVGESIKLASFAVTNRGAKRGWFDVKLSSNKEFFGVVWQIPGTKEIREKYGFKIYNTNFDLINDGEYPLPFDKELSKIHSHHISNTGDYFLALTEYQTADKKQLFGSKHEFKALHVYHIATDGLQDFIIDVNDKRIVAMAMTSDDNNVFTITGVYGERNQNGVSGVLYEQVNLNTGEVIRSGSKEFDQEFITQGWTEREKSKADRREKRGKGEPQLYNYQMRQATIMEDGSIVGTLEQYYVQVRTSYDARTGQSSSTYIYYYNDIVAYKINTSGEFDWVQKILKNQISTNDGGPFSSYESFIDNGQLNFIFNDNALNYNDAGRFELGSKLYSANYSKKRNVVALASVDLNDGAINRRTFFDRSQINAIAVPKLFEVDYRTNRLIFYAIWGYNKEKFGILEFND